MCYKAINLFLVMPKWKVGQMTYLINKKRCLYVRYETVTLWRIQKQHHVTPILFLK